MRWRLLLALFPALVARADGGLTPREVLRKAMQRQGPVKRGDIRDVYLRFRGQALIEKAEHAVTREVWYRSNDRSFRMLQAGSADKRRNNEFGVFGEKGCWERGRRGIIPLSGANRDHRKSIKRIEKERESFERMLRMVLLSRLDDGRTELSFAHGKPVRLVRDLPFSADSLLGKRDEHAYYVLRVERPDEPRMELFVETKDFTVRKVVQFHKVDSASPEWFYYFGPFRKQAGALNLTLPQYLSIHTRFPFDLESRKKSQQANGGLMVQLNIGISDELLRPGLERKNAGAQPKHAGAKR
ncbi:MAG: hypothetical protein ACYSX0_01685 [Planctomycetota bacterium]|jgi:hypothetical protein